MGLWACDFEKCDKVSVRTDGECILCDRHLCAQHLRPEYHTCPQWEVMKKKSSFMDYINALVFYQNGTNYDPAAAQAEKKEVTNLLAKVDVHALTSRASELRNGIGCSISQNLQYDPSTQNSVMGGMNYHIEISFEDGISWLARIRRFNATSPPTELRNYIMRSEVATLKFLSDTTVPAPRVYDFNLDETNPVGVGYILVEKMPGKSLRWSLATETQRKKVIDQLANVYIELQAHPFPTMGSLVLDEFGSQHVGPFARESLADYTNSYLKTLGPFSSLEQYYSAHIELILDLIIRQELYANRPVDAFLIHLYLLENLSAILTNNDLDDGKFYLKHADDKGDHILVDDHFHITGIIDWEWAHTGPKSAAFNSPLVFLPVGLFYDGDNRLGEHEVTFAQLLEEKGHPDLGEIVRKGRLLHRLQFCCGYDFFDWDGYIGIFMGLVRALCIDGDSSNLNWETWKVEAMERFGDDSRLKDLVSLPK